MANILSGIASKTKALGGKAVDLAGKGALYSQMFRNPNQQMTMGQRVGGALSDVAMNATLGQMGSLGQAVRAGLESRGKSESPTGGSGVPSTTVGGKPIKTENVVQAISQSTQQMLRGLNTLNSTFRLGLNNTTNQIQSQSSVMEAVKSDTEDMDISLREIYEVLNKQGYQNRNAQNLSGGQRVDGSPVISQNQSGSNILNDLLSGALGSLLPSLMARILPIALPAIATAAAGYFFDMGLGYLGVGGEKIDEKRDKENWDRMNWWQTIESGFARSIENVVGIVAPNMANEAAAARIRDESSYFDAQDGKIKNPNKSRAEAIKTPTATELTKAEIDEIFRIAPINAGDDVLFEIAKQKFPGRKYNTLKQRIDMLHSLMQPQSSLSTGVKVASADMSSGDYLVSRQKMLENSRTGTSEQALRQEEQKLEKDAFEGVIPQLLNYESREMMYKADKIVFDAGKIEFLQGMGMGTGGERGLIPGGGADNWRPGGTESRDGSGIGGGDASKVPPKTLSSEQQKFFSDLEKGNIDAGSSRADFLKGMSPDQLNQMGLKTVTTKDGSTQYAKVDVSDQQAVESLKKKAASGGKFVQGGSFEDNSPILMQRLMKDFNLTPEQAAGVVGNLGHESAGLQAGIQEKNPVGGGRGGLGWAQWTGPRRKQFEAYLERTGQKASDPEANYGFLKEELMGSESGSLNALKQTSNVEDATVAFEQAYERAGIKHYGPRKDYANKAIQGYQANPNVGQMTPEELANFKPTQEQIAAEKASIEKQRKQARVDIAGTTSKQSAVAGVGPGNVNVKEAYGPGRPGRPDESIRNIASSAAEKAGMSAITFTSGKGDWISPERKQGGQQTTQHSTGRALDVDGFTSDAERAAFIEEAVSMGANGVGVYKGGSIHIDEGDFRSWDLAKKKIYQDAIARGMEKRKKIQEEKQKQADAEKVEEQKPKVKITEESGQEKAYSKLGVTKESKQKMIAESQAKPAAPPMPPAATPAMLDPTSVQSSQKVSELSKKTTMNREASTKQGPVTQNIVNNSNPKTDTTGTGFPDKNAPMLAMTDTMEKFTSHLFGMA